MTAKRDKIVEAILNVMNNPPVRELQRIRYRAWEGLDRKQAVEMAKALKTWHKEEIKKALLRK